MKCQIGHCLAKYAMPACPVCGSRSSSSRLVERRVTQCTEWTLVLSDCWNCNMVIDCWNCNMVISVGLVRIISNCWLFSVQDVWLLRETFILLEELSSFLSWNVYSFCELTLFCEMFFFFWSTCSFTSLNNHSSYEVVLFRETFILLVDNLVFFHETFILLLKQFYFVKR